MRTFGVEEEYLLVDDATGGALPCGLAAAAADRPELYPASGIRLTTEFALEQLEANTDVRHLLADLAADLEACRVRADSAAQATGSRAVALATSPFPVSPHCTPDARYAAMVESFGLTAWEQLTCGCHIHVAIDSEAEGVAVLDRIRPWLPVLTALSTNSPFWHGTDTGYASYRTQVWRRWPLSGPYDAYGSLGEYRNALAELLDTAVPLDEGMIYFDARLSRHHPTVEVRVADVCLYAADALLLAALTRALVETAVREWQAGIPPPSVRTRVLRLASWRASKRGIEGELLHPETHLPCPATAVVRHLVDHVRPVLNEFGEEGVVQSLLGNLLARRTGAERQRRVLRKSGLLSVVVRDAVSVTHTRIGPLEAQ